MRNTFTNGPWLIEFTPDDGGRLDRIVYDNYDLVTTKPKVFRKPSSDYGQYENRPVYGYDDCFPSVEACPFPGIDWVIPDHGEVCWLEWKSDEAKNVLTFRTESKALPIQFKREMVFGKSSIEWNFEVYNRGNRELPFQHVMHPLMKLDDITSVTVPEFQTVFNSRSNESVSLKNSDEVKNFLLNQPLGTANMLFVRGISDGEMSWMYKNGVVLRVSFSSKLFPAIGIWWNNKGYPAEPGIQRNECAFEPIPGYTSNLSEAFSKGLCLRVRPLERLGWRITWDVSR